MFSTLENVLCLASLVVLLLAGIRLARRGAYDVSESGPIDSHFVE